MLAEPDARIPSALQPWRHKPHWGWVKLPPQRDPCNNALLVTRIEVGVLQEEWHIDQRIAHVIQRSDESIYGSFRTVWEIGVRHHY